VIFRYPLSFYLFLPFGTLVILYIWSRWKRRRDILRLGDWRLVQKLIPFDAMVRRRRKDLLNLAGLAVVIIAACGPQFGSKLTEVKRRGVDVFLALDTSKSMLAEDVSPSRLARAKGSLGLLIRKLQGDRVGIIAFAGEAILQCPLTIDNDASQMFLEILDENTVPVPGTSIGDAIRLAVRSFPSDTKAGKALVLLTDGEDHGSDPIEAAKEAKQKGVAIFTIGIGTSKGEVIKERDAKGNVVGFHKFKGEMVLSHLDDMLLTEIATITGGRYYRASSTDNEIDEIADIVNGFDKRQFSSKIFERLQERYQIFALLALLMLLIEFVTSENPGQWRRIENLLTAPVSRAIFKSSAALLILLLFAAPAHADLRTHVRAGNRLFKKGDYVGARGEFETAETDDPNAAFLPYNIGTTYYLEGKLDEARKAYERAWAMSSDPVLRSKVAYNLGHLLFTQGQTQDAIAQFKECLKLNPKDLDAKYNIEYIRSGKKPPPPPKQGKSGKEGGGGAGQQSQKDDKNPGQGKEDNSKAQKNQEQQKGEQAKPQEQREQGSKPNELTKEDAQRILEAMREQEKEAMKDSKPVRVEQKDVHPKQEKKENEDW